MCEEHILSIVESYSHTNFEDKARYKIPILYGRGSRNNELILRLIALNGPSLKYKILELSGKSRSQYSTISRRVDSLSKKGYVEEADTRQTRRGKQEEESMYGLTWKGFIASLSIEEVREDTIQVLEKHPLLDFPAKDVFLVAMEELFTQEEIYEIFSSFFLGYLKSNAPPIEQIKDEEFWLGVMNSILYAPSPKIDSQKTIRLIELLDTPKVLNYVKERVIPKISTYERQLYNLHNLFEQLDNIGKLILPLSVDDKPSRKLVEYSKENPLLLTIEDESLFKLIEIFLLRS